MNRIPVIVKISRPVNFLITFFSVIVAGFISAANGFVSFNIFFAGISAAFAASAGNIINDYYDIEIDKVNRPDRILPSKKLKPESALAIYFIFNLIAALFAALINSAILLILFCSIAVIFFYSKSLKKIPLAGNITVALLTGLAFIYGAVAVNNWMAGIIPALFAFFANLIREVVKDMEDVAGDKSQNLVTFPQKFGFESSKKLITALTAMLIILTAVPFLFHFYKIEYFIIVMTIVNPVYVYILKRLFSNHSGKSLRRISGLLKMNMVFGLIAIFLGN